MVDDRVRTQTFRFTNKFNTDDEFGFGREESEDSIEEDICVSHGGGNSAQEAAAEPVKAKPPLPPSRTSMQRSPSKGFPSSQASANTKPTSKPDSASERALR